ncbi:MAG: WD40/YVTN/BNR-like repeat-containing protein [Gemmatimonadota bacterium]
MATIVLLITGGTGLGARPLPAQTPAAARASGAAQVSAALTDSLFKELAYRFIGPLGNRVISVIGEPGNPNVYYVGAASGGIFKSTDGGHRWEPIFDDQPASSIGSLALAPSDLNVVWAGTGETFIRANISIGDGVYRSTDAGKTWQHMGLEGTERIGRIRIAATNPDIVYVCALGSIYGPGRERGVYRTTDGGSTWKRILFVDENTGCSDLAMDPNNSRILFAGFWQIHVTTWGRRSGGPGSSLWASRDGGDTWKKLEGHGLPEPPWGKIGLGMTAADSRRVYALIETSSNHDFAPSDPFQGVLWRSDDGGESWSMVNNSNDLTARPLYYSRLLASPADADEVYFMALRHSTSLDGGKTHFRTPEQPGGDHHDMWIDPENPDRMIVGHDQGISISTNHGKTWYRPQLPVAQVYHANVDDRIPYYVYGNRQDGPSTRGPSNTLTRDEIPIGAWRSVGGCETGFAVPDTVEPDVVWTGCYDGILDRHNLANGYTRNVSVWPVAVESWPARDLKYRWQWTFPIAISPHDHNRIYVGSQYVHMTTDGGQSWKVISPDLTSNDPELEKRTGGLTLDDAGPTIAPVVFAIAESALQEGLIWAGTNDGRVQVTRDGGGAWTDVTGNLPDLPPRGTISNIDPSRHAPGTAYLTVDRHQLGDTDPYVYRTSDYGASWTRIDGGIPRSAFSYAHCVREDPAQPGLLYLGTENGVWVSFDDGAHWRSLQSNLPHAPVHWLVVQERFGDLVVATYGRGFWILDDISPLRELARASAAGSGGGRKGTDRKGRRRGKREKAGGLGLALPGRPALLAPRPAYRFRTREAPMSQPHDPAAGRNPEYGASLHYYLPEELGEDAPLKLVVLDSAGTEVFHFEKDDLSREAGLHRLYWSLRSDRTREVKLRTKPEENPKVKMPDKGWRPLRDGGRISILEPPGRYTVRLTVGDTTLTRQVTVLKDPNSLGSVADIAAQMAVLRDLYGMLDRSAATINEIEWLRRQLHDLAARLEDSDREDVEEITEAGTKLEDGLKQIEGTFFDLRHTGAGQDGLRWKRLLYARIGALARAIGGSDYPPTDQAIAVADMLKSQLEAAEKRLSELKTGPLAEFNAMLRERGVPNVMGGLAER